VAKVLIDGKEVEVEDGTTVYELMKKEDISFWRPFKVQQLESIENDDCPLTNIVEVDGEIVNPKILKELKVRNEMTINTKSKQIEEKLKERLNWLQEKGECHLIRLLQDSVVRLLQFVNEMEGLEKEKPVIVYDPQLCIGCKACVFVCPVGIETEGVRIFKQYYGCKSCMYSKPIGAIREASK